MKYVVLVALVSILGGCATTEERSAQDSRNQAANADLRASYVNSRIKCNTKPTCDKAFNLTKVFIQDHSDMRIQISDDTIVSTYGPISLGNVGMRATKTPEAGEGATIDLIITCKGMSTDNSSNLSLACKRRVTALNNYFKPFVEKKL